MIFIYLFIFPSNALSKQEGSTAQSPANGKPGLAAALSSPRPAAPYCCGIRPCIPQGQPCPAPHRPHSSGSRGWPWCPGNLHLLLTQLAPSPPTPLRAPRWPEGWLAQRAVGDFAACRKDGKKMGLKMILHLSELKGWAERGGWPAEAVGGRLAGASRARCRWARCQPCL